MEFLRAWKFRRWARRLHGVDVSGLPQQELETIMDMGRKNASLRWFSRDMEHLFQGVIKLITARRIKDAYPDAQPQVTTVYQFRNLGFRKTPAPPRTPPSLRNRW